MGRRRFRRSSAVGTAVGAPVARGGLVAGAPILIEHFSLFPGLLLATERGGEGKGEGGKGEELFHD